MDVMKMNWSSVLLFLVTYTNADLVLLALICGTAD